MSKLITRVDRRKLITGLASLIVAPAIVPYANLMPVKNWRQRWYFDGFHGVIYTRGMPIGVPLPSGLEELLPDNIAEFTYYKSLGGTECVVWSGSSKNFEWFGAIPLGEVRP